MSIRQVERAARKVQTEPDQRFLELEKMGRNAQVRGYYTKDEFLKICHWKSTRSIGLCSQNTAYQVKQSTNAIFAETDDRAKIMSLLKLRGVAVPTASAILAVTNPSSFGVIDIRAWQFLYDAGEVDRNKKGIGLSVNNWLAYLRILRSVAKTVGTSPRLVDIALFMAHKNTRQELSYDAEVCLLSDCLTI